MKNALKLFVLVFVLSCGSYKTTVNSTAKSEQPVNNTNNGYWQQHVDYKMTIDMDVDTYQYHGAQQLVYSNNSPDQLNKVYYHLFFNAFQPGSEMDVRSRTIEDPDRRVKDRISKLKPNEIGFIKVNSLKQNGKAVKFHVAGTILEVELNTPLQPGEKVTFDMDFDNVYCTVSWSSNPGIHSVINGVPAFVGPSSLAYDVAGHDLNLIEYTQTPDRTQWLNDYAWTEYTVEEIAAGLPLKRLTPKL